MLVYQILNANCKQVFPKSLQITHSCKTMEMFHDENDAFSNSPKKKYIIQAIYYFIFKYINSVFSLTHSLIHTYILKYPDPSMQTYDGLI